MFSPITLTGRVTADLELQTSQNNTEYVQFNVAVNKGYGEQEPPNFYQCVLFGKAAERISKAGVKKGNLLFITGDLDLVEFTRKSDNSKGMIPKITVYEWNYIPEKVTSLMEVKFFSLEEWISEKMLTGCSLLVRTQASVTW